VGASLAYGINTHYYENKDLNGSNVQEDIEDYSNQHFSIGLSAALKDIPLDLAVRARFENEKEKTVRFAGYSTDWRRDNIITRDLFSLNLVGRLGLGNGFLTAGNLTFDSGARKTHRLTDDPEDWEEGWTNSRIRFRALLGKEIKATETLKVKLAVAAVIRCAGSGKWYHKDNLYDWNSYAGDYNAFTRMEFNAPFNVAVEGRLNDTWSVSGGVSFKLLSAGSQTDMYNYAYYEDKLRDEEITSDFYFDPSYDLEYAIGLTGHIGDVTLDLFLNPAILFYGPNFISGSQMPMNSGIAVVYAWPTK
jgi:hypothetical protein